VASTDEAVARIRIGRSRRDVPEAVEALEVLEVRRMLEPVVTGMAALCRSDDDLDRLGRILDDMRAVADDPERLIQFDTAFHRAVVAAVGNVALTSLMDGLSSRTVRVQAWRGLVDSSSAHTTIEEHRAIYLAIRSQDSPLAQASALLHVHRSEVWLRTALEATPEDGR
jgi:GntR family transcriptional repressor for pyruvate dehydrogenase complex